MARKQLNWDLFCRVIDNYGDIGVCWRLAQLLATNPGIAVRLWVDNLDRFASLCPKISTVDAIQKVGPIEIRHWPSDFPVVEAADVVIEAFACEIPAAYVTQMARRTIAPIWVNVEYLSAEAWIEGCHLLTSPQFRLPLTKYFFFPGFTPKTGGLLREHDLHTRRSEFDHSAIAKFWKDMGIPATARSLNPQEREHADQPVDELRISLFCYDNSAMGQLLNCWAEGDSPVRVLATPGAATDQIGNWFGEVLTPGMQRQAGALTVHVLPFLSQPDYDRLLWACDVNFVRGEDSFVRAQWAEHPFVWQIYPQNENTHLVKLEAFLSRYLNQFQDSDSVRSMCRAWNGLGAIDTAWEKFAANRNSIEKHGKVWASELDQAGNLADNLLRFVDQR